MTDLRQALINIANAGQAGPLRYCDIQAITSYARRVLKETKKP